jgi:hypothetical protein
MAEPQTYFLAAAGRAQEKHYRVANPFRTHWQELCHHHGSTAFYLALPR